MDNGDVLENKKPPRSVSDGGLGADVVDVCGGLTRRSYFVTK